MSAEHPGGMPTRGALQTTHPLDLTVVRELLHDALHELAAINTLTAAVEADESCSPPSVERLQRVQRQTVAVAGMLREVFLTRLQHAPVKVRELLEEIAGTFDESLTITVRVDESAPELLLTDQLRLRRVVRNLMDNAARAAGPGGVVELSVTNARKGLVLTVDDSGPGFGHGPHGLASLGLQIVTRLVGDSGGRVTCGASHLGGARVQISLPSVLVVEAGGGYPLDDGDEEPSTS
jgi:signal transduction histidine kinase